MPNEKILVVDDDTNICELLRLYLEKEGYVVKIVNDGVSAINAFKQENPDLTLLDIMIPKLDGWQVCREIRKFSDKPIIMLTAKGETFDKVLGLELGADDYVTKPFDTKEVVARKRPRQKRKAAIMTLTVPLMMGCRNIWIPYRSFAPPVWNRNTWMELRKNWIMW